MLLLLDVEWYVFYLVLRLISCVRKMVDTPLVRGKEKKEHTGDSIRIVQMMMMLPQDVDLLWVRLVWPTYLVRVYIERMFLVLIVGRNFFRISGRLIGPRFSVDDSVIGPSVFRQSRLMDYFTFYGLLYSFRFLCFCFPRLVICPIAGSVFTAVFCCRSLLLFSAVFSAVVVCCCFFWRGLNND